MFITLLAKIKISIHNVLQRIRNCLQSGTDIYMILTIQIEVMTRNFNTRSRGDACIKEAEFSFKKKQL